MDPISQGALGAVAALAGSKKDETRKAVLIGWGSGMLADADVLIRSASDPLLAIEYHRHFTHSLFFIPVGALLGGLLFKAFFRSKLSFKNCYVYSLYGYATAGMLDACTSYGTHLLWPFSNERIAWNAISIIDPVFTGMLLALIVVPWIRKRALFGRAALGFAVAYLMFGFLQHHRATLVQENLISERGHASASRAVVKPALGNLALWRSIYWVDGEYFVDGIRVGYLGGAPIVYEGGCMKGVDARALLERVPEGSALEEDIRRFAHFSNGYIVWHPEDSDVLSDLRYGFLPNSILPLWGIRIEYGKPDTHAPFLNFRDPTPEMLEEFWSMVKGEQKTGLPEGSRSE